jgi:hypothetical protein
MSLSMKIARVQSTTASTLRDVQDILKQSNKNCSCQYLSGQSSRGHYDLMGQSVPQMVSHKVLRPRTTYRNCKFHGSEETIVQQLKS